MMDLITYGCGNEYDRSKFERVKNRTHHKALGGLWSSPVNSEFGWKDWCEGESFGDLTTSFTFSFTGNILTIDTAEDLDGLKWIQPWPTIAFMRHVDYEDIARRGFDAIHLTEEGEQATRWTEPHNLYGWDCETVFIINPNGISVTSSSLSFS